MHVLFAPNFPYIRVVNTIAESQNKLVCYTAKSNNWNSGGNQIKIRFINLMVLSHNRIFYFHFFLGQERQMTHYIWHCLCIALLKLSSCDTFANGEVSADSESSLTCLVTEHFIRKTNPICQITEQSLKPFHLFFCMDGILRDAFFFSSLECGGFPVRQNP